MEVTLDNRRTLDKLLKDRRLYTTENVAKMTGRTTRYIRRLCHAKFIKHHRILGRYYFTKDEVALLVHPVLGAAAALK